MKKKLQLFVWTNFCRDYTGGLAFAIANDVIEAQKMIEEKMQYGVYDWGTLSVHEIDKSFAECVSGGG
jgi:hypothetical protein